MMDYNEIRGTIICGAIAFVIVCIGLAILKNWNVI